MKILSLCLFIALATLARAETRWEYAELKTEGNLWMWVTSDVTPVVATSKSSMIKKLNGTELEEKSGHFLGPIGREEWELVSVHIIGGTLTHTFKRPLRLKPATTVDPVTGIEYLKEPKATTRPPSTSP